MRTHDMSLANRFKDLYQHVKERNTEMVRCRNKIYDIAVEKWDSVNRLGLN